MTLGEGLDTQFAPVCGTIASFAQSSVGCGRTGGRSPEEEISHFPPLFGRIQVCRRRGD